MIRLKTFCVPALLLTLSGVASAQATRTWVSGVGDDVNPCSRTAPCKTFAGAISKTAAGGEIDALDPGGFGGLTITKSVTIDGGGFVSSVLAGSTNGILINASTSDTIILRNLTINAQNGAGGTGVYLQNAGALVLENVVIQNFSLAGVNVAPFDAVKVSLNQVQIRDLGAGTALIINGSSPSAAAQVSVRNSSFSGSATGLSAGANAKVTVTHSNAFGNSGAGFSVSGNSVLWLIDSTASGNAGPGFKADSNAGTPTLTLVRSTAASNTGAGVQTTGTGTSLVGITGSALLGNGSGVTGSGTTYFATYGDNEILNGVTGVTVVQGKKQ